MDELDKYLLRATEIFMLDLEDPAEEELKELLPPLVEAGYVEERPWGEDYEDSEGWSLWNFTKAGNERKRELEAGDSG